MQHTLEEANAQMLTGWPAMQQLTENDGSVVANLVEVWHPARETARPRQRRAAWSIFTPGEAMRDSPPVANMTPMRAGAEASAHDPARQKPEPSLSRARPMWIGK
jgi:hypothetical protein